MSQLLQMQGAYGNCLFLLKLLGLLQPAMVQLLQWAIAKLLQAQRRFRRA